MRARQAGCLALLVIASSSCGFDARLAPGIRVRCAGEVDCPTEHVCDRAVGRCIAAVQPFTSTPTVTPALAKEGTRVTVRFSLAQGYGAPLAVCAAAGGDCFAALTQDADDGTGALAFSWVVDATAPEGLVRLQLDARGAANSYSGIALGSLVVDRTAPALTSARLGFEGTLTNPLVVQGVAQALGAVGSQADAVLTLELREPLASLSVAAALPGGASLDFALEEQSPSSARLRAKLPAPPPAGGSFPVTAQLTDLAGNRATVELPEALPVRSSAPPALAVDAEGLVRFRRAPRGTSEDSAPRFTLEGGAGAAPLPGGAVLAFNEAGVVGRAPVAADGSFGPVALALLRDLATVQVQYLDAAGNASALAAVRDVSWLAVDRPLGAAASPIQWREVTDRQSELPISTADSELRPAVRLVRGGVAAKARGGWRLSPSAYDAAGFSGSARSFVAPSLLGSYHSRPGYALQGGTTATVGGRVLIEQPFACSGHAVCDESVAVTFDLFRRGLLFFGGRLGAVNWAAADLTSPRGAIAAAGQPAPREYAAVQWQGFANATLLFGGVTAAGPSDETWELVRDVWTRRAPANAPPARSRHTLVEDPRRRRVLLFGGRGADGGTLNDTWAWNGSTWSALDAGATLPSPREAAALGYDAVEDRVLLVGGARGGTLLGDTWTFDGAAWSPLGAPPLPPRRAAGLGQEAATGLVVLSGGMGASADGGLEPLSDTWLLDGGRWSQIRTTPLEPAPDAGFPFSALQDLAKAWDPVRRVVVAHGGGNYVQTNCGDCSCDTEATLSSSTWEFDGKRWAVVPGGEVPGPLVGATLGYDPLGDRMLLAGGLRPSPTSTPLELGNGCLGCLPNTLVYERRGQGPWVPLPAPPFPARGREPALAFEPSTGQMLLQGGTSNAETWGLQGSAWTLLDDQRPAAAHRLVWSDALRRIFLISASAFEAVWSTRWSPVAQPVRLGAARPLASTSRGEGYPLVMSRGGVQVFTGSTVAIQPVASSASEGIPSSGLLFFDAPRDGYGASTEGTGGQVRWLSQAPTRPAVALTVSLAAAAPGKVQPTALSVRVWASARGADGPSPAFGPELHLLAPTGFTRRAAVTAADSSPVEAAFTVEDRALLGQLLDSVAGLDSASLGLEVSPRANNADGRAAVAVERVEVEFSWRLPAAADGGTP